MSARHRQLQINRNCFVAHPIVVDQLEELSPITVFQDYVQLITYRKVEHGACGEQDL